MESSVVYSNPPKVLAEDNRSRSYTRPVPVIISEEVRRRLEPVNQEGLHQLQEYLVVLQVYSISRVRVSVVVPERVQAPSIYARVAHISQMFYTSNWVGLGLSYRTMIRTAAAARMKAKVSTKAKPGEA
jgi:hypothetical protein